MDFEDYYPGEPISFYTKVAGVSKENRQDLIQKYCRLGMSLYPICEPENEFDKYAVALYVKTDDGSEPAKIGYIPAKYSHALYKNVELGLVEVDIDAITGGDEGKYLGVNLYVTITPDDENEIQNLDFFLEDNDYEDNYSPYQAIRPTQPLPEPTPTLSQMESFSVVSSDQTAMKPQKVKTTKVYATHKSDKNYWVTLILCISLGFFGFHHFYVGRFGKGLLYLITVGLFCFGWIFDIFKILSGTFTDSAGTPIKP